MPHWRLLLVGLTLLLPVGDLFAAGETPAEDQRPGDLFSVSVRSDAPGRLFTPDQLIALRVGVASESTEAASLTLRLSLAPHGGRPITVREEAIVVSAEAPAEFALQLPPQPVGLYDLSIALHRDGEPVLRDVAALGVLPAAEERAVDRDAPFGVVAHLNREPADRLEQTVQLMARAGVRWAREGFLWHAIEPAEGKIDWSHYDLLVDTCERYGISVLPVLAYGTPWATSDPQAKDAAARVTAPRLDAWRAHVERVVRRYGDRIKVWEIWNEPNSTTFFRPAPGVERAESYAQLLDAAYQTIKRVDPEARVIIGGFTPKHWIADRPDLHEARFMEAIYRHESAPFDVLGYHPYTAPKAETTHRATLHKFDALVADAADVMDRHAEGSKPVWITEMGTPVMSWMDGDAAAAYLAVLYVHVLAQPRYEAAFWYDFRDDGTDPAEKEHNFGLLRYDFTPKPALFAYHHLTRRLAGARFVERASRGGIAIHRFDTPRGTVLVVWAQEQPGEVALPVGGRATVYDVYGTQQEATTEDGQLRLTVTKSPLFVEVIE